MAQAPGTLVQYTTAFELRRAHVRLRRALGESDWLRIVCSAGAPDGCVKLRLTCSVEAYESRAWVPVHAELQGFEEADNQARLRALIGLVPAQEARLFAEALAGALATRAALH